MPIHTSSVGWIAPPRSPGLHGPGDRGIPARMAAATALLALGAIPRPGLLSHASVTIERERTEVERQQSDLPAGSRVTSLELARFRATPPGGPRPTCSRRWVCRCCCRCRASSGQRLDRGRLVVLHLLGVVATVGVVVAAGPGVGRWSDQLHRAVELGPRVGVVGAALLASAGLGPLQRRRLRLVVLAGLVMMALYSGFLGDVLRVAGGVIGLLLGMAVLGRGRGLQPGPSSRTAGCWWSCWSRSRRWSRSSQRSSRPGLGPCPHSDPSSRHRYPDSATVPQVCAMPSAGDGCAWVQARGSSCSGWGPG